MFDVCDLNNVYQADQKNGFVYSLPKQILENMLAGTAFGYRAYTEDELAHLREDIKQIFTTMMAKNPDFEKNAYITAGSPGSGKTTLLERIMDEDEEEGVRKAYVDPDAVCLKFQTSTYQAELAQKEQEINEKETTSEARLKELKAARQEAYNKWRSGSNAANHLILANLIREGIALSFGTTASAPQTAFFFKFLKDEGYKITLIHLSAPDAVRWESVQERDQRFVQTTEEDIREKGKMVPQRIMDTYLKFADEIKFYYRNGVDQEAKLAATWIRDHNNPIEAPMGVLSIVDQEQYHALTANHDEIIMSDEKLSADAKASLLWENTVLKYSHSQNNASN